MELVLVFGLEGTWQMADQDADQDVHLILPWLALEPEASRRDAQIETKRRNEGADEQGSASRASE
jgi:hypothetical protein